MTTKTVEATGGVKILGNNSENNWTNWIIKGFW